MTSDLRVPELAKKFVALPQLIDISLATTSAYTARKGVPKVDGIAVVDVSGILVNDSEAWDGWGFSTYGRISGEVLGALQDPSVEGIMIRVDSPGGETSNAFETANVIASAARSKPVWAVADVSAYSAGYLLLSAAQKTFVAPTSGGVGSIGVYSEHWDYSGMLKDRGVEVTLISAGKGKTDGHPAQPLSDEARDRMQSEVNRLYDAFVSAVSVNRRISPDSIREMGAVTKHGAGEIISSGLADQSGSFESAMQQFRAFLDARKQAQLGIPINSVATTSASATRSRTEVRQMAEPTHTADATEATAEIKQPSQSAQERPGSANIDAIEIAALCTLAGTPDRIHEFLAAGTTAEQVRSQLLREKHQRSETEGETISQTLPSTSAGEKKIKPENSPLVAAMAKLGKEF